MTTPETGELLRALPEGLGALVARVLAAADAGGVAVYLVGGPVRDLLLGRPLRDVDLLVDAGTAAGAAQLAGRLAGDSVVATVHDRFGTVTLQDGAASLDLATVRRESYAHAGALPQVEPGSLEEDLQRRDFSVNALALPLSREARARGQGVVGVEGALDDLEARRLRVLHPGSFRDDPTRALRAARLAPRLGFSLSRDSRAALRDALREGAFGRVSGERLRREIGKLFDDAALGLDPSRALALLDEWHVLGALEPGLLLAAPARAPLRRLGRAVAAPPWPGGRWRPWVSGLALWLAPLPAPLRGRSLRRFAVRGEPARRVAGFPRLRDGCLRRLERARGRGSVDEVLADTDEESLHALACAAPPGLRRRIERWARQDRTRRAPLSGADLVELGLAGPAIGVALRRVRRAWLDGAVRSREEALVLARELTRARSARRGGRRPAGR